MSGIKNVHDAHEGKSKIFNVDLNVQSEAFKLVTALSAIIFVFSVLFFSILRLRFRQIYAPRLLLIENKLFTIATIPRSFFAWITPAFRITDDDIYTFAGIDALVYIRFLKLVLKFAVFTLPYGFIVLLPLNIHGGNNLKDSLDKLTMSNVTKGSKKIWAHFIAVWVYTLAVIYLTYQEWKVYISYRQKYLKKGSGHQFGILVQDIPSELLEENALKSQLDEFFPNKISSVYIVEDLKEWDELIQKHNKFVLKYERAKFTFEKTSKRPMISKSCCGTKVDAIVDYEKELQLTQEQLIDDKSNQRKEKLSCALVFFKTLKARAAALQSVWTTDPFQFNLSPAPEPNEIVWKNLNNHYYVRQIRLILGYVLVFFLILFWTAPIIFISGLTKLESAGLRSELGFLDKLQDGASEMVLGFIQGVVPVLLIALFYLVLPYILYAISYIQGFFSKSSMAMMVFQCLFVFQTFNTFFIYIISGSILQNLEKILQHPFEIPSLLAKSLPSQSGFFINYLALASFGGLALELTRIVPLIVITIKLKCFAKTSRERLEAWRPKRPEFEVMYSQAMLFFLIGISYSILSPIIIPFFVLYYAFGYVVWVYQLLHVYIPEWEHGGQFWPEVFYRILVSVVVFQLLMIGVFFLKEMWYPGVLVIPILVLTIIYWWFMRTEYKKHGDKLVVIEAANTETAEKNFLEDVKKRYVRNSAVPEIFELSNDDKFTVYDDYIPISTGSNNDTDDDHEMTENGRLLSS